MCVAYLNGLCLDGSDCKYSHPSFDIPAPEVNPAAIFCCLMQQMIVCHSCGELGHKVNSCPKLLAGFQVGPNQITRIEPIPHDQRQKPLNEVTCYKVCFDSYLFSKLNIAYKN